MSDMLTIGELRDKKMTEEIVYGLREMNIPADHQYVADQDIYIITVPSEEYVAMAQDFFRVKLGFKKPMQVDQEWVKIKSLPRGEMTYAMILVCVGLYLLSFANIGDVVYSNLFIGKTESSIFYEIIHGQIWRLITPIFLHLSFLHILFNMLWFKDLGYLIEFNFRKNFLIVFVLLTGLFSNVCQYMVSGPQFGGMSGVLYAMLGFIWVYKKLHDDFEYAIPKSDIGMMIGWYFLCLTGLLGPIANTAHGAGLVAGMVTACGIRFQFDKTRLKYLGLALFFLIFTLVVEGYKLDGRFYLLLWK